MEIEIINNSSDPVYTGDTGYVNGSNILDTKRYIDDSIEAAINYIPAFYNREEIDEMMKKMQDEIDVLKSGSRDYRIGKSMDGLDFIHDDPYEGYVTLSREDIATMEELEYMEEFPDILPGDLDDDLEDLPKSMDVGPELIDVTADDDDDIIDFDCIIDEDD